MKKSITKLKGYDEFKEECFFVKCTTEYPGWTGEERFIVCADLVKEELQDKYPEICEYISPFILCNEQMKKPFMEFEKNQEKFTWRQRNTEVYDQIYEEGGNQLENLVDREIEFELRCEVREALDTLTTTQRNRVYQYFFMGLNYRDIATREGVTSSAVSESINRALEKLKKFLS